MLSLLALAPLVPTALGADVKAPLTELVTPLVEDDRFGALVVTVISDGEVRTLTWGDRSEGVSKTTAFEIGSVSKVFTGVLLATAVSRGEVSLSDPLSKYLDTEVPTWQGKPITLLDLATHTSGLPRLPDGFVPSDPSDPYAGADAAGLLESLAKTGLDAAPGDTYLYSNLGAAMVGQVLEKATGQTYEALLAERITTPLGMGSTAVDRPPPLQGHDADGQPVPAWTLAGPWAPVGGIHSTAADLTRFLAAHLRAHESLGADLALASRKQRPLGEQGSIGLFWHRTPQGVVWHNGQTGGFHALIAFAPERGIGVVALGDTATDLVDQVGFAALELAAGETVAPIPLQRSVDVGSGTLQKLAGQYGPARVTFDADALWFELPNQPRHRLWPESATRFHLRTAPVIVTIEGRTLQLEQPGIPLQEWKRKK